MSTRDRILASAEELFRTRGFNAFSYYDLAEALQVQAPAIHYHFRTKDDLAVAILEMERSRFADFVRESVDADPMLRLKRFVASFAPHAEAHHICLVGASGGDYYTFGTKVQAAIMAMADDIITWLTQTLRDGRRSGVFAFSGQPATRAKMIAATLAASLHLARILGVETHRRIARQLLVDLTSTSTITTRDHHA